MLIVIILSSIIFIILLFLFIRKIVIAKTNYISEYLKFDSKFFKFSLKHNLGEEITLFVVYSYGNYHKYFNFDFKNRKVLINWLKSFKSEKDLAIYIGDKIFYKNEKLNLNKYKRIEKLKNIV
jgi:hypothetical protein